MAGFAARRAEAFDRGGLDPFLDAAEDEALAGLAFKRRDLESADARRTAFFVAFDLDFAFVPIGAATYTR